MPDYFPLAKGAVREYTTENSAGAGTYVVEVLDVEKKGAVTTAKVRRTVKLPKEPGTVAEVTVTSDAAGVREGAHIEFNRPVKVGTEWIDAPRRNWIEALDAEVETPAGTFTGCLRVAYLIAEGDGGSGERFYAPGVGLVKVVDNDEGEPLTLTLVKKTP
jgi:hypothetical protein